MHGQPYIKICNSLSYIFRLACNRAVIRQCDTGGKIRMCYTLSGYIIVCVEISLTLCYINKIYSFSSCDVALRGPRLPHS